MWIRREVGNVIKVRNYWRQANEPVVSSRAASYTFVKARVHVVSPFFSPQSPQVLVTIPNQTRHDSRLSSSRVERRVSALHNGKQNFCGTKTRLRCVLSLIRNRWPIQSEIIRPRFSFIERIKELKTHYRNDISEVSIKIIVHKRGHWLLVIVL